MNSFRSTLIYCLKNSDSLLFLYNWFYRIKNKKRFFSEIEYRSNLSLFDIYKLAQDIPYYPIEKVRDSNDYGHAYFLKQYTGCKEIKSSIEHGLYLGNRITVAERYKTTKSVIAMSQNRVDAFKDNKIDKEIIAIGPYIHYAVPYLNIDEFAKLKQELGRVLLVIPTHSLKNHTVSFDIDYLIHFVNNLRSNYDTVLVCLHFNDVIKNLAFTDKYKKEGYKIVCAGHRFDYNFLSRLKSIILLSDFVVSNSFGTNTGYCTYLNKPQVIVTDKTIGIDYNVYEDKVAEDLAADQIREIESAFSEVSLNITDKQRKVVEKYWSPSMLKSKEELRELIEKLNKN